MGRRLTTVFFLCFLVFAVAVVFAHLIQTDFGRVEVSDVHYLNYNGKRLRAKLFRPVGANPENRMPGVVFIHGYQNNRESGDAYNIELAKRGFVVLGIDAIGRGNSDMPFDMESPAFDKTFGTRSSVTFLRSLPFVRQESIGLIGHSMGAQFAYQVALEDATLNAVVIIGSAYDRRAGQRLPRNMLMIIGELDEFRDFFTQTQNIVEQWMQTEATRNAFPSPNPRFGVTYGDFADGSARRVFITRISHIQESHSPACVAEALDWMRQALHPAPDLWLDPSQQTWPIKEAMTLLALIACFLSAMPLTVLLLKTNFFSGLRRTVAFHYACSRRDYLKGATLNGLLMWLYLPLIMTLFAIHKYVVPVDAVFPMLLVDAIVWWFVWINLFGLFLFRRWYRKAARESGVTLFDLGVSDRTDGFYLEPSRGLKTVLLALILFGYLYAAETLSETLFLVDFRFIYPLVSDLTPYRFGMFWLYFPFLGFGFLILSLFIHGQLRRPEKANWFSTYWFWTRSNVLALITPIFLFLLVQYVPLLTTGFIPFEGPGGVFVVFILELFFIMLTLTIVMILSTWFYQLTGRIYLKFRICSKPVKRPIDRGLK